MIRFFHEIPRITFLIYKYFYTFGHLKWDKTIKKQGVPWDCFLSYKFRTIYRQAMRLH